MGRGGGYRTDESGPYGSGGCTTDAFLTYGFTVVCCPSKKNLRDGRNTEYTITATYWIEKGNAEKSSPRCTVKRAGNGVSPVRKRVMKAFPSRGKKSQMRVKPAVNLKVGRIGQTGWNRGRCLSSLVTMCVTGTGGFIYCRKIGRY